MLYRNSKPSYSRLARRAALAALLASVAWQTNALADEPSSVKLQLLPPLPVQIGQAEATTTQMKLRRGPHVNPFCQPQASVITLVSGEQPPGSLQPAAETLSLQPVSDAIDESLDAAEGTVELVRPQTTMRLLPIASDQQPASDRQPAAAQPAAATEPITFSLSDAADAAANDADNACPSAPLAAAEPVEMSLEDSMSDSSAPTMEPLEIQDVAGASPLAVEAKAPQLTVESADPVSRIQTNTLAEEPQPRVSRSSRKLTNDHSRAPSNALDSSPIVVEAGVTLDRTASLVHEQAGLVIDVPEEIDARMKNPPAATRARPVAGTADVATEGLFAAPQRPSFAAPQPQAPAAASPVAASPVQPSAVQPSPAPAAVAPSQAGSARATQIQATQADATQDIQVGKAQMHALQIAGSVRCFAVEDEAICQVLPAGLSALRVVGQRGGSTRLAVWVGTDPAAEPLIYNVHVDLGPASELDGLSATADKLTEMLLTTFPQSRVRVQAKDNQLIVRGVATDDQQASRMLRLVRQTCLVPVVDNLTTR